MMRLRLIGGFLKAAMRAYASTGHLPHAIDADLLYDFAHAGPPLACSMKDDT